MRRIADVEGCTPRYDLLVIGAGPAGMAAAATASALGLATLVADENAAPGGQIYRAITRPGVPEERILGADYWAGRSLAAELDAANADYAPATTVWTIAAPAEGAGEGDGFEVGIRLNGRVRMIAARRILVATGALERPFPVPGWTLPGVMTAGAAQIALKASGLVPEGRAVLAGSGPLLYLLASQLLAAGARVERLLDTTPRANWRQAWPHLPAFLASGYFRKGLKILRACRAIPTERGVRSLAIEGEGRARAVRYRTGAGERRIEADIVLLHQGVVPNTAISNALGVAHAWDETQLAFVPRVDSWFGTDVAGLAIAGDGAGIAGAEAAALRGRIAALGLAAALGRMAEGERDAKAAPLRRALGGLEAGRRFVDVLYRPAPAFRVPEDDATVVCRCEEVTAGALRQAVALGARGPNQAKVFTRCGMGPCQGRMCALTVTELIARELESAPAEVGSYRSRPPFKPITVGELAGLPYGDAAVTAVERLPNPTGAASGRRMARPSA